MYKNITCLNRVLILAFSIVLQLQQTSNKNKTNQFHLTLLNRRIEIVFKVPDWPKNFFLKIQNNKLKLFLVLVLFSLTFAKKFNSPD
jgi:hypothetical protein